MQLRAGPIHGFFLCHDVMVCLIALRSQDTLRGLAIGDYESLLTLSRMGVTRGRSRWTDFARATSGVPMAEKAREG